MNATMWVIFVLALLGWGLYELRKKGIEKFWRLLAETNKKHGTSFGTSPDELATVVGVDLYHGGALAFDRTNRKLAYITRGGSTVEILGYSFVQSWQVTWREKTSGGGAQFGIVNVGSANTKYDDVFLVITTNDLKRPLIKMPMSSLHYAQETAARLKIMINSEA